MDVSSYQMLVHLGIWESQLKHLVPFPGTSELTNLGQV